MVQMTYCGNIQRLKGLVATVRPGATHDQVLALFDDPWAMRNGVELNKGWHAFAATDFMRPIYHAGHCPSCD